MTETPQPEIKRYCRRCVPKWSYEDEDLYRIISPSGVAHIDMGGLIGVRTEDEDGYGMTLCGIDATGPTWWWRL